VTLNTYPYPGGFDTLDCPISALAFLGATAYESTS